MTNEESIQKTLNLTIERFGRQVITYEAEIAKLNYQIIVLSSQIEEIKKATQEKPAKVTPIKE